MPYRNWPAILLVVLSQFAFSATSTAVASRSAIIEQRERQFSGTFKRNTQFANVAHVSSRPSCEDVRPPEALATPNPLVTPTANGRKVKVSFIIGTDGHVHSPLILESSGLLGDWHVLQTVRTWRYRPATCNGVPTETEGKVEFSSR
jgi:TonB family protein